MVCCNALPAQKTVNFLRRSVGDSFFAIGGIEPTVHAEDATGTTQISGTVNIAMGREGFNKFFVSAWVFVVMQTLDGVQYMQNK